MDFKNSISNINNQIKLKLSDIDNLNNKKNTILLIATDQYIKYIVKMVDSCYFDSTTTSRIFVLYFGSKNYNVKQLFSKVIKYLDIHFLKINLPDQFIDYKSSVSANIRFHAIHLILPYCKKIIYVDCDSICLKPIEDLFTLFDSYSLVLKKHSSHKNQKSIHYFPIKSGFIYLKNNQQSKLFLLTAIKEIESNLHIWYADQKSITRAYYNIDFDQINNTLLFDRYFFDWHLILLPYIYTAKGIRKNTISYKLLSKFYKIIRSNILFIFIISLILEFEILVIKIYKKIFK